MYETKDSGARAEFAGGMLRDTNNGKVRVDLCFPDDVPYDEQLIVRWGALMARGAEKYSARNWELGKGEPAYQRARESAMRHFMQWYLGEDDEDHAAAVCFNMQAAILFEGRRDESSGTTTSV